MQYQYKTRFGPTVLDVHGEGAASLFGLEVMDDGRCRVSFVVEIRPGQCFWQDETWKHAEACDSRGPDVDDIRELILRFRLGRPGTPVARPLVLKLGGVVPAALVAHLVKGTK